MAMDGDADAVAYRELRVYFEAHPQLAAELAGRCRHLGSYRSGDHRGVDARAGLATRLLHRVRVRDQLHEAAGRN